MNFAAAVFSPSLALLDMLGGSELLVIFLLVLIFFGGEKMPDFARGLGKAIREFRKAASGVEQEFKKALEEEPTPPRPPYSLPTPTIMPPQPPGTPASVAPNPNAAVPPNVSVPLSDPPASAAAPAPAVPSTPTPPAPPPSQAGGELDAG